MKFRKRAVAICIENEKILCVLLKDPVSGAQYWIPPGGGIEDGEEPAQAAEREMLEETGLRVVADRSSQVIETYPFHWAGDEYLTENHYFIVQRDPGDSPANEQPLHADKPFVRESYILAANWLEKEKALKCFQGLEVKGYKGEIYDAVKKLLPQHVSKYQRRNDGSV